MKIKFKNGDLEIDQTSLADDNLAKMMVQLKIDAPMNLLTNDKNINRCVRLNKLALTLEVDSPTYEIARTFFERLLDCKTIDWQSYEQQFNETQLAFEQSWQASDSYIEQTLAATAKAERLADVKKNPAFKIKNVKDAKNATLKNYVDQFVIVDKIDFSTKLQEIAKGIKALQQPYSCIVSEAGKSNYWITAKVLFLVKQLGGYGPEKIIAVPTKEDDTKTVKTGLASSFGHNGHLIFLDDGSYSGNQLSKLIAAVIAARKQDYRIGLVAISNLAKETLINKGTKYENFLATPIEIKLSKENEALNSVMPNQGSESHKAGNSMLGFYYKIPDYASVRYKLLTNQLGDNNQAAVTGYVQGKEPYKVLDTKHDQVTNTIWTYSPISVDHTGDLEIISSNNQNSIDAGADLEDTGITWTEDQISYIETIGLATSEQDKVDGLVKNFWIETKQSNSKMTFRDWVDSYT